MTMIDDTHTLELLDIAERIRMREISPVALARAQLDRIAILDPELRSFVLVTADDALAAAEAAEAEIAAGRWRGPLHGVPLAVKDLFWMKGVPTAGGMAIHRDFRPPEDATVVRRLREAGAVLLGKTQLTEGAYSDYHPSVTAPRNPWGAQYWPGISSSGSAVATAAGFGFGALASDTGGSIRWPAAANGVTGLKPTWGRVSRHGAFALAPTMDHVGVITRSAADAGAILRVIAGPDPDDPTARPAADYRGEAIVGCRGMRIGVDPKWNGEDVDPSVQAVLADAVAAFRELGAEIVEIAGPDVAQAIADWPPACAAEAAVAHRATYPARKEAYGPVLASVIEAGLKVSGLELHEIWLRRLELRGRFEALFGRIDVLLAPAHPFAPLTLETIATLGAQPKLIAKLQRYTCPFDLTGHPTITLPGGFSAEGAPIGFQLVAAKFDEARLVRGGGAYQGVTNWHRRRPRL